jgi:hypothetical protein
VLVAPQFIILLQLTERLVLPPGCAVSIVLRYPPTAWLCGEHFTAVPANGLVVR